MRILTILGKVDSRPLVYPLARALSLNGLTGIITDDGSYRRLYHGKENIGTVNCVDIGIVSEINDETVHILDDSGVPYDNLIIVSQSYIHKDTTGMIICHGRDRSMMAQPEEDDEDDEFLLPLLAMQKEAEEKAKAEAENSDDKKKKSEKTPEVTGDTESTQNDEPHDETIQEKRMRIQEENPDIIVIPEDKPYTEVQIAYEAAPKKTKIIGISLKEGLISYVYKCEEQKQLAIFPDQNFNKTIVKIAAEPLGIEANELNVLLNKEEGAAGLSKGKAKK